MSNTPVDSSANTSKATASPGRPIREKPGNSIVIIIGGIMLAGLVCLAYLGTSPPIKTIGEPLPLLDLQPLVNAAAPVTLQDLEGKLAVLHFWGTWCPPCRLEFPEFVELINEFDANPDVKIVSVSCSQGAEYDLPQLKQKTIDFLSKFDATIPTYADPAVMTRGKLSLILPNGSLGYPTTLLVDRDGKIVQVLEGYLEGDMRKLASQLRGLL